MAAAGTWPREWTLCTPDSALTWSLTPWPLSPAVTTVSCIRLRQVVRDAAGYPLETKSLPLMDVYRRHLATEDRNEAQRNRTAAMSKSVSEHSGLGGGGGGGDSFGLQLSLLNVSVPPRFRGECELAFALYEVSFPSLASKNGTQT